MHDFIGQPTAIRRKIKGVNDTPAHVKYFGKGYFNILDSKEQHHKFIIDQLYYCKTIPMKVISPQHIDSMWKRKDINHRIMSAVDSDGCILRWIHKGTTYTKFIPINNKTGVPMFTSAPRYQQRANCMKKNPEITKDEEVMCCQACKIIDEDHITIEEGTEPDSLKEYPALPFEGAVTPKRSNLSIKKPEDRNEPVVIEFGDDNIEQKPIADNTEIDTASEMLFLHYKLGHLSFNKVKQMARDGLVPKKFLTCRVPMCASSMYGAATKRPWRTKHPANQIGQNRVIESPGACVSIDQFESPVPGLIAHVKGTPTKARYKYGTVFVDHYSDMTYVHFQKTSSAAETIEAKEAFERWSSSNGVKIRH
jgi:hypothetical protein